VSRQISQIAIVAQSSQKAASGFARIQTLGPSRRVQNALRQLGLYWGIGLFCVLFPLLHFILVPFFLILGVFLAARAGAVDRAVVDSSIACPECGKPFQLKTALARWPLNEVCQSCRWSFSLSPDSRNLSAPELHNPG
jgi:hypothetical protein